MKQYKDAIVCLDKAIEKLDGGCYIYFLKGNALFELEDYEQAIQCYDEALNEDPFDQGVIYKREEASAILEMMKTKTE